MRKNVGSQVIGAQMVSATDGSAFSGAVTVYVTGDGGSQTLGTVGAGACAHEGNGFHTYVPAQAETNYDHIGFTFIGSGAVPATVQVYPSFPQTGDAFARLGAPAGASIAADLVTIDDFLDTEIAAILADTNEIQTDLVNGGRLDLLIDAIKAKTDNLPAAPAAVGDIPSAATVADAVWDEATSGHAAAGSTGKALTDVLDDTGTAGVVVASIAANAVNASALAADAVTEIQSGLATAATLSTVAGYLDTEVAAILADTNELQADWANGGRLDLLIDAIKAKTDLTLTAAQVNAEVVDALATDTYAEPGQGAPDATATLAVKLGHLYKLARNKVTQDATTFKVYADDGTTVDAKATVSDDSTTFTRGELVTGP